jgi:hypothetical protein
MIEDDTASEQQYPTDRYHGTITKKNNKNKNRYLLKKRRDMYQTTTR